MLCREVMLFAWLKNIQSFI